MKQNKKRRALVALLAVVCTIATAGYGSQIIYAKALAQPIEGINKKGMESPLVKVLDEIPEAAAVAALTQEWHKKALAITDGEADVYAEAVDGSQVAGKAYSNTILNVLDKGEQWSKVSSGSLTGYVKNDTIVAGKAAMERSETVCPQLAKPNQENVELKVEADAEADSKGIADVETQYSVLEKNETWIKVQDANQEEVYVASDMVTLTREVKNAMTVAEIEEEKAAQEAARIAEEEAVAKAAAEAAAEKAAAEAAEKEAAQANATSQNTSTTAMSASSSDQTLLAAIIYCEAGNQPYEGQVAVGAVILNRVRSGTFPNTIREVIYQSGQFGPAITGKLDRVLAAGSYTDTAVQAAGDALAGSNPIGGALYFGNGNTGQLIGDHYFH